MAKVMKAKKDEERTNALERELILKQMQINFLMDLTKAINDNVASKGLFEMYRSFLSWQMNITKMALFIEQKNKWSCVTSIGLSKSIIGKAPIEDLHNYQKLKQLEENNHPFLSEFNIVIPVRHKDSPLAYVFIHDLSDDIDNKYNRIRFITTITNIVAVAIENKRLFKKQIDQVQLKKEMQLAMEVQNMLIPKHFPENEHFELDCIYKPRYSVGGDYYDYLWDKDEFLFCIGDITGKGMPAALLMANFQANFHRLYKKNMPLDEFVRQLNTSIFNITKGDMFLSFFIARYNIFEKTLCYVNAGHPSALLTMKRQITTLDKGCPLLGTISELPHIEVGSIAIHSKAQVVSFTDGLSEIKNKNGRYIDKEDAWQFIIENNHLSAKAFNEELLKNIEKYKGNLSFKDDFTVLTCKLR